MNLVTLSRLQRNPTIKTEIKERGFEKSVPVGFLTYPISQAADITAFDAKYVPGGEDQEPILEQDREIVRAFNSIYGETLVEPYLITPDNYICKRLPGTDGKNKMSKSLENCIYGQVACEAAYTKGLDWVKKQRHHLTMNRNKVYEFVKANKLKVAKLEGTYLMWIDISMLKIKQEDIYQELINYNILVNMGTIYDEASTGIIRFNIACSTEQLEKGLEYLKKFIDKYR